MQTKAWEVRKTWGGWQVFRLFTGHAEIAPGTWRTEALAKREAAKINKRGRAYQVKVIPA